MSLIVKVKGLLQINSSARMVSLNVYTDLRRKYLPRFCWSFININKFKCLMGNDTERSCLNTGKFIYYAANRREEFLSNV